MLKDFDEKVQRAVRDFVAAQAHAEATYDYEGGASPELRRKLNDRALEAQHEWIKVANEHKLTPPQRYALVDAAEKDGAWNNLVIGEWVETAKRGAGVILGFGSQRGATILGTPDGRMWHIKSTDCQKVHTADDMDFAEPTVRGEVV